MFASFYYKAYSYSQAVVKCVCVCVCVLRNKFLFFAYDNRY